MKLAPVTVAGALTPIRKKVYDYVMWEGSLHIPRLAAQPDSTVPAPLPLRPQAKYHSIFLWKRKHGMKVENLKSPVKQLLDMLPPSEPDQQIRRIKGLTFIRKQDNYNSKKKGIDFNSRILGFLNFKYVSQANILKTGYAIVRGDLETSTSISPYYVIETSLDIQDDISSLVPELDTLWESSWKLAFRFTVPNATSFGVPLGAEYVIYPR